MSWRDPVLTKGASVTVQATPPRQSRRLASPMSTDSSYVIARSPVIGQNWAGVRTATGVQPGSPPVQRPDGATKPLYAQST